MAIINVFFMISQLTTDIHVPIFDRIFNGNILRAFVHVFVPNIKFLCSEMWPATAMHDGQRVLNVSTFIPNEPNST